MHMELDTVELDFTPLVSTTSGELFTDKKTRLLYATDASAYREVPVAVFLPKNEADILQVIDFASRNKVGLIPRTAGTSLAGQVVGKGIVVDVSKYFTQILELNVDDKWVRVQPGVILDELNQYLAPHGLFFGPETSTSNRCMIGGMVGNNSCGAHSLIYGSTRDHTLEVKTILSDGSRAHFKPLEDEELQQKLVAEGLEGQIYREMHRILSDPGNQNRIGQEFPHPDIKRRNTGYALDLLLKQKPYQPEGEPTNFSALLAGSEGTLAFTTEIKLNLVPLPPAHKLLLAVHLNSLREAMEANLIVLKHRPVAIELMDKAIMDLTKENIAQNKNRFFVEADPAAMLLAEFAGNSPEAIRQQAQQCIASLQQAGYGYAYPLIEHEQIKQVWELRKAGLGVLGNMPGDAKPVPVIEDTAVRPEDLPAYMEEFNAMLQQFGKECVYYAHIATGELHLRPVLNLKDPAEVKLFHEIALESAKLVKKYRGSLSGEHGDGRLRGQFIPLMVGEENYQLIKQVKSIWDPNGLFNPGKIVDTPPMNTSLRYDPGKEVKPIQTYFSFAKDMGILRAAEKCNGTAACRKTEETGGTMCPSYMGTRDESASTRARANVLREFLTNSEKANPFDHKEIYEVMDLCLSCKACKSECPSSVDVAKLKAEFLQHYYDEHFIPIRTRLIAYLPKIHRITAYFPALSNFFLRQAWLRSLIGFAPKRNLPPQQKESLQRWFRKKKAALTSTGRKVYLFNDEFTNFLDTDIGIKTILLLERLGYEVSIPPVTESGRTYFSKGLVRTARGIARKNVEVLSPLISDAHPLLGIEPSAILSFRDEYPEIVGDEMENKARDLAKHTFMVDEFLAKEFAAGRIDRELFTDSEKEIKLHGHCQQKSIASVQPTVQMLSIPSNYRVKVIPSGCCGMAGSFGYEKEHYDLSMKIGGLVLFPAVKRTAGKATIAAPGTSCRHQIMDGTGVKAQHPVEILFEALR